MDELSVRDQFALAAMQGLLAAGKSADSAGTAKGLAQAAYAAADAMMAKREADRGEPSVRVI